MAFQLQKAKREKIFTKIALLAPSGGGKTYSALRLATGMASEMKKQGKEDVKILLINTEGTRGRYYANEFEYYIEDVVAPHNPEKYIDLINGFAKEVDIIIIDSASHEWEGKGGCLELQQLAGGTYQAWSKVTPRHNKFMEALALSPVHIIATMRGKDQYEVEKDDRGKTNVKKLGVGAKQRDGFEYEFTCSFLIDQQSHLATIQKDNTHIFDNEPQVILTEQHGEQIIQWANSGEGYTPPVISETESSTLTTELDDTIKSIAEVAKILSENGTTKATISDAIKDKFVVNGKSSANYNAIKDIDIAKAVLENLQSLTNSK